MKVEYCSEGPRLIFPHHRCQQGVDFLVQIRRALAYLYLPDGTMFNEVLLEKGYAQVATFPPNVEYLQEFGRAQKEARRNERGIWGLPEDKLCRLTDRGNGIGGSCQSVSTG